MAVIAPAPIVQGAARAPLPYGLFSALALREGSSDRWQGGVEFVLDQFEPLGGIAQVEAVQSDTTGLPKDLSPSQVDGTEDAYAFTVYGHFSCSPIGWTWDSAQERATTNLLTMEEARVEQALWTGDLENRPNFAGANGYAAADDIGSFSDVTKAIGAAESWLARNYGSQGVIHLSRVVAAGSAMGVLESAGGRLRTKLGTPVVAGTGYGDDAVVATPAMFGYRSEVFESGGAQANFDRLNNQMLAIAERTYLIGFDPVVGRATLT